MPDQPIITKTIEGIVTSWSPTAETIFGYTAAEMIGSRMTRIFPPECLLEEPDLLDRLRRGERIENHETSRRTKAGRIINVSITLTPIQDEEGRTVTVAKAVRVLAADTGAIVRRKMAAGVLPADAPARIWAGPGNGNPCDVCGLVTTKTDLEYEADMPDGRTLFFHQKCLGSWHEERANLLEP